MIKAITGRTGEGKSCYATRWLVVQTLLESNRPVVTNIAIDKEEIKKYIEEKGGEFIERQLIVLPFPKVNDKGQAEKTVLKISKLEEKENEDGEIEKTLVDYEKFFEVSRFWECCPRGSLVIMDEAAEFFNAYDLGQREQGRALGSYARLHRHLEQDVFFLLQDLTHMSKQLRDLVQEHITLYSFHQHPFLGFLRMKVFCVRYFDIGLKSRAKAYKMEWRGYDKRIFKLYDSHQHSNFHQSLDYETGFEKKLKKRSFLSKFFDRGASSPIFWLVILGAVGLVFGVTRLGGWWINEQEKQKKSFTSTEKKKEKKEEQPLEKKEEKKKEENIITLNKKEQQKLNNNNRNTYETKKARDYHTF